MAKVNPEFIDEIRLSESFDATACMHCGQCTAMCPLGLDLLPRQLFRYVGAGLEGKVLENVETIFSCLLCKLCEENCPREVHIAENVRFLRNYVNRKVHGLAKEVRYAPADRTRSGRPGRQPGEKEERPAAVAA
ncbi:MAG: 4Fe-4S dicluster domain-containing protein [Acidobacteriota bacterium]|jgi:heterodisulfide reductase subunit C